MRHENPAAIHVGNISIVSPTSDFQVRSAEGVQPELREERFVTRQLCALENASKMRVGDNFLHDGVAAVGIGVRAAVAERVIG